LDFWSEAAGDATNVGASGSAAIRGFPCWGGARPASGGAAGAWEAEGSGLLAGCGQLLWPLDATELSSGCFGVGNLLRWIQRSTSNGNANVSELK